MNDDDTTAMLLRGGRIVLPGGVVDEKSLLVKQGRIARIADEEKSAGDKSTSAERVLRLEGLTLFPGFIDVHIHGAIGVDTMDADPVDLGRVSDFLAGQGVTGWLPTFVPAPEEQYARAVDSIERLLDAQPGSTELSSGARVLGVHYEGPFINAVQCGALHGEYFRTFSGGSELDELPVLRAKSARHMMTMAPEVEGGVELVRKLSSGGWVVSIGHTAAPPDVLDRVFEAGARHMTHFMNAMPPLHHRAPGPVGWCLSRDDVTCDMIADGIHLDEAMLRLLMKLKTSNHLTLISDAIASAGMGDGEYQIWGETIEVKNGRTRNARGSIAGSVITMLDAARMMFSLGASEVEVARMTATNPARLLGIDGDCGSIEEGKRADLVALDDAGNVQLTIVGGRICASGIGA